MKLPDFLIVGSMKSGTTSLYHDLVQHPQIFLPEEKEPDALCRDDVLSDWGLRSYAALFEPARPHQLCGEASTSYTKLPTHRRVPERARTVLGDDVRIVYLVRDPVERTRSHHEFLYQMGLMGPNVDSVLDEDETLIEYSRYALQIQPWIDIFGREQVMILQFETYVRDRQFQFSHVCEFLGAPENIPEIDSQRVSNRTGENRQLRGFWRNVRNHPIYLKGIRKLLPGSGRSKGAWLRELFVRDPLPSVPPMTDNTRARIAEAVREDATRLAEITEIDLTLWTNLSGSLRP